MADKVLHLADYLCTLGCFELSADYCYGRYLYTTDGFTMEHMEKYDSDVLIKMFFPDNKGEVSDVDQFWFQKRPHGKNNAQFFTFDQNVRTRPNKLLSLKIKLGGPLLCHMSVWWLFHPGIVSLITVTRLFVQDEVVNSIRALIGYSSTSCKAILLSDPKFHDPGKNLQICVDIFLLFPEIL